MEAGNGYLKLPAPSLFSLRWKSDDFRGKIVPLTIKATLQKVFCLCKDKHDKLLWNVQKGLLQPEAKLLLFEVNVFSKL
jgi:hypothetical protein